MYIWEVPDDWNDKAELITVSRAFMVLQGHRSIVNQVRFNAATHMLISAGVEKVLKVGCSFKIHFPLLQSVIFYFVLSLLFV